MHAELLERTVMVEVGSSDRLSNILERITAIRSGLSPAAGRIADFIRQNAAQVVHMSVTEVAEQSRASEGSVVNFCQQLGARGFQQIKMALARDLVQPVHFIHEDLSRDDELPEVVSKIFGAGLQALKDTQGALDLKELEKAIAAIRRASRVEVFGIGSAAPIAEDASYRLLRIGLNARASVDSHVQAIVASLCDPTVAVLTISHSGSTIETLTATKLAKQAGATTIAVTNFGRSPLLAHTDIVLHTLARETQFRTEAMTSRIAQLAVVDALIAALALADYERSVETIDRTFDVLSVKRV
jgi:DNA-binding MurR/RpiR family transcriptional regulator